MYSTILKKTVRNKTDSLRRIVLEKRNAENKIAKERKFAVLAEEKSQKVFTQSELGSD